MNTTKTFALKRLAVVFVSGMLLCGLALPVSALQLSLGIRETAAGGGPEVPIGGNAGTLGGIEFVNRDGQSIIADGLWHAYTWDLDADTLTAFAGTTANSILDGAYGSIENLRFLNDTGFGGPITIWIDSVVNTISSGPVSVQSFEGFADGTEVMFQEPSFSGSTSANIAPGSTAGVDNSIAFDGAASYKVDWTFVDNDPTRWLRLTTFGTGNSPNPLIRFDQASQVTIYLMAVIPEPSAAMLLLAGGLVLAARRRRA